MTMTLEDYRREVRSDLLEFAKESFKYRHDITVDEVIDMAGAEDSVCGNASGSYTFDAKQAQENIAVVIFDKEVEDMFKGIGYNEIPLYKGAEAIDVFIRFFLIYEFYDEVKELLDVLRGGEHE